MIPLKSVVVVCLLIQLKCGSIQSPQQSLLFDPSRPTAAPRTQFSKNATDRSKNIFHPVIKFSCGTGQNGVPQPVSGVPTTKVVVPPPGNAVP